MSRVFYVFYLLYLGFVISNVHLCRVYDSRKNLTSKIFTNLCVEVSYLGLSLCLLGLEVTDLLGGLAELCLL